MDDDYNLHLDHSMFMQGGISDESSRGNDEQEYCLGFDDWSAWCNFWFQMN